MMASSPSHKFGQIIGGFLEYSVRDLLQSFADNNDLYLDYVHSRAARQHKKTVEWTDNKGNRHRLDYVLEKNGSETTLGLPKAFIESAWRRYTKHSRNKAQEIQGAIIPLAENYCNEHPFLGVILGGDFTVGSLTQLESHGFSVLYFPYESIIKAFATVSIDAYFEENTPDEDFEQKVISFEALDHQEIKQIRDKLHGIHCEDIKRFMTDLDVSINRKIKEIVVLPLHGESHIINNISEAITFLDNYDTVTNSIEFVKFELIVRYTNGDRIEASFKDKLAAKDFLKQFTPLK